MEILITCLCRYLKKKSNKNDFPLRKAPATETTTTLLSRIESWSKTFSKAEVSNSNVWSSFAFKIQTGLGVLSSNSSASSFVLVLTSLWFEISIW